MIAKILVLYEGQFKMIEQKAKNTFVLENPQTKKVRGQFHANSLKVRETCETEQGKRALFQNEERQMTSQRCFVTAILEREARVLAGNIPSSFAATNVPTISTNSTLKPTAISTSAHTSGSSSTNNTTTDSDATTTSKRTPVSYATSPKTVSTLT